MNTKSTLRIIAGLSVIPLLPAAAIEPPPENNTPPAAMLRGDTRIREVASDEPFLGVATASVPGMVADHLGLTDRSGLIVRTVSPDSPAAKAGIAENDIIVGIDGKTLSDPEEFSALVRGHKVGDRLALDLIQKGKAARAEVTLVARPAEATARMEVEPMLEGIPKAHADRLRDLIERDMGAFGGGGIPQMFPDGQIEETFRQMRERMNRALEEEMQPAPRSGGISFRGSSTVRLMDGDGSVEITSADGETNVTVRGKDNKVEWSGPWNTDEDKAAAPEDIRKRLEGAQIGKGGGFSFRFGTKPEAPGTIDN